MLREPAFRHGRGPIHILSRRETFQKETSIGPADRKLATQPDMRSAAGSFQTPAPAASPRQGLCVRAPPWGTLETSPLAVRPGANVVSVKSALEKAGFGSQEKQTVLLPSTDIANFEKQTFQ